MPDTKNRMDQGTQRQQGGYEMRQHNVHHEQAGTGRRPGLEHTEGSVARAIEQQTAKLPSDTFLWAACGCMGASLLLQCTGNKHAGLFVGQWVAPLMLFGIYNKIVKVGGSDRATAHA